MDKYHLFWDEEEISLMHLEWTVCAKLVEVIWVVNVCF